MRVGVVGCGYWGSKHVRVLSGLPQVSDVVIIDSQPDVRVAVAADHPAALQRPDLTSALDELDAVVVATPPESHFDLAAEAIAAGKHVLIEKPMTTSTADARQLVDLAEEAGVVLATGHTFAYNDAVSKLTELIRSGHLGRLHYLDAARLGLGLYRHDVNVLWDLAAHDVSIATLIMGTAPDTVAAWGDRHTIGFREDVAAIRMHFTGPDVISTARASWLDPERVRRTTAVGSERMAIYDDADPDARIQVVDRGRRVRVRLGTANPTAVSYRDDGVTRPEVPFREPLLVQAMDFIRCCGAGARPVADGWAGVAVVAVLEASDVSLQENGAPIPVDLPHLHLGSSLAVA